MSVRGDLRNVAVVGNIDHGKTTLIAALLRQGAASRGDGGARLLDSGELEREKGITIQTRVVPVRHAGVRINLVDTPGHADFRGEVERGMRIADGVLLLVDGAEGPRPQTRFVLRRILAAELPFVVTVTKVDRQEARPKEVLDELYEMLFDLDPPSDRIDFPVIYCSARQGWASSDPDGECESLAPLLDALVAHVPGPSYEETHPLQALVADVGFSTYLGTLAICRILHGTLRRGATIGLRRADGALESGRVSHLSVSEGADQVEVQEAGPGEIVTVAGPARVSIGDTVTDPGETHSLPPIHLDEPSLSITVGANTAPLAGVEGTKLSPSLIEERLEAEQLRNVSIRVVASGRRDTWEVQGRGELQLAVFLETLRREGFELTVGKPAVVTKVVKRRLCEPTERLTLDIEEEFLGPVTRILAARRAQVETMSNEGGRHVRIECSIPSRGLVGFPSAFLTETRGAGIFHHAFDRYDRWRGDIRLRATGSLVADRAGRATAYALLALEDRGTLFVEPGDEVYEGMVVGEHARPGDLNVNPTREKKLTNMRSAAAEELVRGTPARRLTLEEALAFVQDDECVELTPQAIRVRKAVLQRSERARPAAPAGHAAG